MTARMPHPRHRAPIQPTPLRRARRNRPAGPSRPTRSRARNIRTPSSGDRPATRRLNPSSARGIPADVLAFGVITGRLLGDAAPTETRCGARHRPPASRAPAADAADYAPANDPYAITVGALDE